MKLWSMVQLGWAMLSEINKTKKKKSFHWYEIYRIAKFTETESSLEVTKCWKEGEMGSYCLMGTEFLFGMVEKF